MTAEPLLASSAHALPMLTAWAFVFASSLVSACLTIGDRRFFGPIHLATWFFALAIGGLVGQWSVIEFQAATILLMAPHALIAMFPARSTAHDQSNARDASTDDDLGRASTHRRSAEPDGRTSADEHSVSVTTTAIPTPVASAGPDADPSTPDHEHDRTPGYRRAA